MANLKDISLVRELETLSDEDCLIVSSNGYARRFKVANLNIDNFNGVPTTRTVNGKSLNENIELTYEDVNAVPTTRTVNGKSLNEDITLTAENVNAVPTTRAINGFTLDTNIALRATDVNAMDKVDVTSTDAGKVLTVSSAGTWAATSLPKASAVADAAGNAPTAAEFNALLAALRTAGLIANE